MSEAAFFKDGQREKDRFHKCSAMESGNGGALNKGVLVPVSDTSDVFKNCILTPLQSAYLYEESKQSFRYKSAVLIKNPQLEEKYNAFRAKRREVGYTEADLKEKYGFLLFDDVSKAHALGEAGVLCGNSTCTTLGDPSKGVYISMYSDCLDLNRWYHGKSGYIAIIRLTEGRVKKVFENYTQNFTAPTGGFDCHVSEQLPSVSANTSSFLAFERTQYYMYELLDDGSNETASSPSAACPFAIVSFSYTDTKATTIVPQEKSEVKTTVGHYLSWRGQLQIGTQSYNVGLRSTARALITGKLPLVVKVEKAISMLDLRQLLPRTVFETCFSGEVFLDGLYCNLCELVPSEEGEANSLSLLVQEVKERDIAFPVSLNDGGFLILLHSSNFLSYDDGGSNETKFLQGLFVFPESRLIQRDTKFGNRDAAMSSEILQVLPVLSYAEGEVEKTTIDPSEELCEVLAQHMQSYAALINPGLALVPSREVSMFPDQYDVPDTHKHLYSSPEWTSRVWQSFRSYLSKPLSFQLPVSKALELLADGQEERREDLDDDVYICLSSPEEAPANPISTETADEFTVQKSSVNFEASVDSCITSAETHIDSTDVPQNLPLDWHGGYAAKDNEKSDLTVLIKKDTVQNHPTSDDLPAELIVSITSAKRTVTDESLDVISTVSALKRNDFELSGFSADKLQTGVNCLNDETSKLINGDYTVVTNLTKRKRRKLSRRHSRRQKKTLKAAIETPSLQTVQIHFQENISESQKDDLAKESSHHLEMSNPSKIDWRKLPRRKRKFGKLSKNKNVRLATVGVESVPRQQSLKSTISMEFDFCPMRKKTERWDLKPVVSECGRILAPFGSVDFSDHIKSLKDKLSKHFTTDEQNPEKLLVVNAYDTSVNVHDKVEMVHESSSSPETAEDKTETTTSKDGVNVPQKVVFSDVNPDNSLLKQSDGDNEKHTDNLATGKCARKSEFLLSKLKSVLLRGKRKTDVLVSQEITADTAQDTEPCVKKGKVESSTEAPKSDNAIASVQESVEDVSEMLSLDPLFAYALGLTPKEKPEKVQKTEVQHTPLRKDSSETQEQPILDKQSQIVQRPLPISPRRGRIKTLKKHQGIPAEHIKKKWWLHFQTPACFASEKLKNKECTRDNSVRKTVKGKINNACSSTDALNLLADLALNANNGQVPQQPDPALERKPETSFKKYDVTKDVTSAEQESVLHTLLRQPAARPTQAPESPTSSHLLAGSEILDLISKEHDYSLPPSSSLLLGLPGTPFQVCPLSGSTRLLHHHQQFYGSGIQTLHPSVCQEDRGVHNHRTPEYLKKHVVHRQTFRYSRTFVNKDGSIQVTRQWKENYDFNLDSKFTNDSKDRAVVRALHGPWDFSIQDTNEEVRLIVHMWIGLFYSRSTARFFHVDSNFTYPCSEEDNSLEMFTGMTSAPAQSELKETSFAPLPNVDTSDSSMSKALDLSKKDTSALDQDVVILDLSVRNSSEETDSPAPQVQSPKKPSMSSEKKEASETLRTLKSVMGLDEESTFQPYKKSMDDIIKLNGGRSINGYEKTSLQRAGGLDYTHVTSHKGYGSLTPPPEKESVSVGPENVQTAPILDHVLHRCSKKKMNKKDTIENSGSTEMGLVHKHATDSSKSVTNKDSESNKEAEEVVHTIEHVENEPKVGVNSEMKENTCKEDSVEPPKEVNSGDNSTKKESSIACNVRCLENEEHLSREEPKAVSPGQCETADKGVNCCTAKEGTLIKDKDQFWKKHGLNEEDRYISFVEAGNDLSNEPLPMTNDHSDSVKDCITNSSHQAPFDEQQSKVDGKEDFCHNLLLRKLSGNGSALTDENAISEKTPQTLPEMKLVCCEPVREKNSERDIFLADKAGYQKPALPTSDASICSLHGSCPAVSALQTKDSVEPGSQNIDVINISYGSSIDQETKSIEEEVKDNAKLQKEQFHDLSHSLPCEFIQKYEAEEALTKETETERNKMDKTNEGFEKTGVVIPFIGIDISGEDIIQPHVSHPQAKVEEVVQGQTKIPFISETTCPDLPTGVCSTSQMYCEKTHLSVEKMSRYNFSETNQSLVLGSESDDRCPTPTMDEKPYGNISGPSLSLTQKCLGKRSAHVKDEIPIEQKHSCMSNVNSKPDPPCGLHLDLELRTQRVLQSINKFLSKSNHTDKSHHLETPVQTSNPSSKHIATCLSSSLTLTEFKGKQISNTKSEVVSASTSREPHTQLSEHYLILPFKSKLEEVLGVRLQLKNRDSPVPQHFFDRTDKLQEMTEGQDCHSYTPYSSQCLQDINIDQDDHKTSQSSLNHELRSYSQRPVMAVKPSKSDESQDYICKDGQVENSSKCKTKNTVVTYTTPVSVEKTENVKGISEGLNDHMHACSDLSSESSWLSSVGDCKSNLDQGKFAHLDLSQQYQGNDTSKYTQSASPSQSKQSFASVKGSSKFVDGNQGYSTYNSVEKISQTAKEKEHCLDASVSFVDYKNNSTIDDRFTLVPETSLVCTVYNTSQQRCYSFLEQVSKRCLQDDITQASVEQENLIFYEEMKQLLKRSKRGPINQEDVHDKLKLSCTSPLTVHFSSLEEQDDSLGFLDAPSLVGQKLKVDLSDRKDMTHARQERKTLHPQGTGDQVEHAGVSDVTEECARLYESMMNGVCSARKVPSRSKYFMMDRVNQKNEPYNNFDFCDQMKREMDESFHNNLNSVVKKSCKTKYRFYILVTSDAAFFEETKAELEAQGHTAVEPSEFFPGEDSSSLLIILRNEDIAEHICEVPHLVELKKSPGVQFAGIDEPDDVVNLTHQELFIRGGFIMFNRAALESLSLCNMKKISEILQELSRTGKWKWMLHYRDSRRLKENARLSDEAKQKTHFLNWCQDTGILEVLPYHDCDLMSKDQPDYLACLVHLQVQNISARYPVFITGTATDTAFGRNGILTMTVDSFLTNSAREIFAV